PRSEAVEHGRQLTEPVVDRAPEPPGEPVPNFLVQAGRGHADILKRGASGYALRRVMLRLLVVAALAAVFAVPAYATPTELMPGVTYDRQLVLSRFGPQVVHVVTSPRPGGLYSLGPIYSNGVIP